MTLNYTTLHYATSYHTTPHYTTPSTTTATTITLLYTTLEYTTLQYITLTHYTTTYATATTLHQLHYTTTTAPLHYNYNYSCTTPHYIQQLWVRWPARWPLQPMQPFPKTQLQPPLSLSVDSLCHPWFTTTNLSYRYPIFETSETNAGYYYMGCTPGGLSPVWNPKNTFSRDEHGNENGSGHG